MTTTRRRFAAAALCGLALVLGGCNDSSDPEPEPTASLQQPADGESSEGSARYQEGQESDDDATPDADDSDDATPDADDSNDSDDATPDADDSDDDR